MEPPQITPEPDEAERKAILAALAAEEEGRRTASRWAQGVLPAHVTEGDEP